MNIGEQIPETDFLLIMSFMNYPEWKSSYTMEQYGRVNWVFDCFKCLNQLNDLGFITSESRGQMSFHLPTEKGKNYILEKYGDVDWNRFELSDTVRAIVLKIFNSLKK